MLLHRMCSEYISVAFCIAGCIESSGRRNADIPKHQLECILADTATRRVVNPVVRLVLRFPQW
jgi:hypothetical protein